MTARPDVAGTRSVLAELAWRIVEPAIRHAYEMGRTDEREKCASLVDSLEPYEHSGYYAAQIRARDGTP